MEARVYSRKRQVLSAFLWIVGWPFIIGALAITIVLIVVSVSGDNINSPNGTQLRGAWAFFVGVLVVACQLCIWLKSRKKTQLRKISATVLSIYMWTGIVVAAAIMSFIPDPQVSTADAGINVQQTNSVLKPRIESDQTIHAVLTGIGAADLDWVETKFVPEYSQSNIVNQAGEYQAFVDTAGNWSYGVLTVKQGETGDSLNTVVAHEYLHHVWFKVIDTVTKEKLTSDLITIYGGDAPMQERVKSYSNSQLLQPTELFSFYCTEVSDSFLTPYILSQCNEHIKRSVLKFDR